MEIYRSNGGRPTFHSKIFNFGGFAGLGLIGNYLLGGVVLHGNLQVKWRPTHIPQQNFQFWWICGFGAYWELFARGGCFTWKFTGQMEVKSCFGVGVLQFWWVCSGARCFESVLAGGKRGVGPAAVPELFCFSFKTLFKIPFYLFSFFNCL